MSRDRPARRWCHAATGLDDFAIVTWALDPDRLAAQLPAGFVPEVRNGAALVSAVAFLDDRFHFNAAPWPRISCGQVNYRAYVRRPGAPSRPDETGEPGGTDQPDETGVWFLGTSLDSPLVAVPRLLWQMPWHRDRLRIAATWSGDECRSWRLDATGAWGGAAVELRGTGRPFEPPAGFVTPDEVSGVLLDPFVGWYARRDGSGVGRYSVWHQPLVLEQAEVVEARCQVFLDLDLLDPGDAPISAGLQRQVWFDVHTPPTRVAP